MKHHMKRKISEPYSRSLSSKFQYLLADSPFLLMYNEMIYLSSFAGNMNTYFVDATSTRELLLKLH